MDYLPLFTRLSDAACLVVGGGAVAARKSRLLLRARAQVTVVAPNVGPELMELAAQGNIRLLNHEFMAEQIDRVRLVIAATDDPAANRRVAAAAEQRNCLCNVVDDAELSTAILPAIIDRAPLIIAVSSGGRSPVLVTLLRQRLEAMLPANYGRLAEWAGRWRTEVKNKIDGAQERLRFWQHLLNSRVADQVLNEELNSADAEMHKHINKADVLHGIGWLVGAGPGDPELLTLKALRCLQTADVIIHDRLINSAILEHARRDAETISVGKTAGKHGISQAEINQLLVRKVASGLRVCRLKGGDPFIFGRGGEELAALKNAGLDYAVIPGITAASGCAAAYGVPLTHRETARSVTFVTAQTATDQEPDWTQLAGNDQTVVMYMSLGKLAATCQNLIDAGRRPDCPTLLIENGTTSQQRSIGSDLTELPELAANHAVQSPTLLIVGDVAAWAESNTEIIPDDMHPWLPAANTPSNLNT